MGPSAPTSPWPQPLDEAAFHGPAGELVRAIEPHSEGDPAALLTDVLVGVGSIFGSDAHMIVEADKHPSRLFAVHVGETAKARKGTSWGRIRMALSRVDPMLDGRTVDGLSSGEGLIWAVHDPIEKTHHDKATDTYTSVVDDPGVEDKRLLVVEGEFGRVLTVMSRPTNTLSAVPRNACDSGSLRSLTKNSPAKATGAHISMIGHITRQERLASVAFVASVAGRTGSAAARRRRGSARRARRCSVHGHHREVQWGRSPRPTAAGPPP